MPKRSRPEFKTKFETTLGSIASPNKDADEKVDTQMCNDFFLLKPDFGVLNAFFQRDKDNEQELKLKSDALLEKSMKYISLIPESDVDCIRSKNALEIAFFVINNSFQQSPEKISAFLKECAKVLTISSRLENSSLPTGCTVSADNEYLMTLKHTAITKFIAVISAHKTKSSLTTENTNSLQKADDAIITGINIIDPAFDFAAQCLKSNNVPCKDIVLLLAVLISSFSSASYVCAMITRKEVLATMIDLLSLCMYDVMHPPEATPDNAKESESKGSFSFWGLFGFSSAKKDDDKIPDKQLCSVAIPALFVLREFIRLNQHFKECVASTMIRRELNGSVNGNDSTEYDEKKDFPRNLLEILYYSAEKFESKADSHVVLTYSLALDALLCMSIDSPKDLDAIVTITHNDITIHGPAVVLALNGVSKILSKPISYSLIEINSKTLTFCQYAINSFFSSSFLDDSSEYLFISSTDSHSSSNSSNGSNNNGNDVIATAEWDTLWKGLFHIIHFVVVTSKTATLTRENREKIIFFGKQTLEILGVSLVQANRMAPRKPAAVEGLWYEFMRTKAETSQLLSSCCENGGSDGWWSTGVLITAILGVLNGVVDTYESTTITMEMVPSIIRETRKQIYSDDKIVSLLQPLEPKNPIDDPRNGQHVRTMITNIILNNEFNLNK